MALAGAMRAIDARFPLVLVSYLLQVVHTQVNSYNVPFPISTTKLLLLYASRIDVTKASLLLAQIATAVASVDKPGSDNDAQLHDDVATLQRQVIHGPFVRLEDDVSALTLEEAIMRSTVAAGIACTSLTRSRQTSGPGCSQHEVVVCVPVDRVDTAPALLFRFDALPCIGDDDVEDTDFDVWSRVMDTNGSVVGSCVRHTDAPSLTSTTPGAYTAALNLGFPTKLFGCFRALPAGLDVALGGASACA
ncbi:hypothetical protein DYB32_006202 [Aphanomyces invadans]|uniref:Uncharacterized protein n=1 Tax=Aphanomyces invadans TaxID=157072 RepID=A0A3R6VJU4_9STRA|nr:hypothetical protein DYB32_006202 [Aphanomyces invadans]